VNFDGKYRVPFIRSRAHLDAPIPFDRLDGGDHRGVEAKHRDARRYWSEHPAARATEVRLAADLATIIGVRWR